MTELTPEMLMALTPEQRKTLAEHMYSPIRCGGMHWDENGQPVIILGGKPRTPQEHDTIVRQMNPKFSEEDLRKMGALWCDPDGVCRRFQRS